MIFGIGFSNPFLVGMLALCLLLFLIFIGVRVVFFSRHCWLDWPGRAAGLGPSSRHYRHHPTRKIVNLCAERFANVHLHRFHGVSRRNDQATF